MKRKSSKVFLMSAILLSTTFYLAVRLFVGSAQETSLANVNSISEESVKGLYDVSEQVFILDNDNFKRNVYNSSSAWLVEFYNEWCGHCIKFAPKWKQLALDICDWKSVVKVAAINCADEKNTQLCRDYEIMGYPTLRYFYPHLSSFYLGDEINKSYVEFGITDIADLLTNNFVNGNGSSTWPNLKATVASDIPELLSNVKTGREFLILVVEPPTSSVGSSLILYFQNVPDLVISRTNNYNLIESIHARSQFTALYAIGKEGDATPLKVYGTDERSFYNALRLYLSQYGIEPKRSCAETENEAPQSVKKEMISRAKEPLVNKIHPYDLLNALRYTIYQEICVRANIDSESRLALIDYLNALINYLPIAKAGIKFLQNLREGVEQTQSLTGADFKNITDQNVYWSKKTFPENLDWVGCKGSSRMYRGYPCGLWVTFHTLTVQAGLKESARKEVGKEILMAIVGYVKHFFGCRECSQHFQKEAQTIDDEVDTIPRGILWLWKTHNSVNKRISGDLSEDPVYPKIQFPSTQSCPDCGENGNWNTDRVLKYLTWVYALDINMDEKTTQKISDPLKSEPLQVDMGESGVRKSVVIMWVVSLIIVAGFVGVIGGKLAITRVRRSHKYKSDIANKV